MNFKHEDEFKKDLKRLTKKWRSIPQDVKDTYKTITALYIDQDGVDRAEFRKAFFNGKRATVMQAGNGCEVVKMRLDVASLGTGSKVRLIFIAVVKENEVSIIELYAKNEKDREDQSRVKKYQQQIR